MAFGDLSLDAPEKPNKGLEGGSCNRRSCQAEPALWWNHGSYSWYCADCARDIGDDVVNRSDWARNFFPKLGHPQFETREMIDAREAAKPPEPARTYHSRYEPDLGFLRPAKPQSSSLQKMLQRAKRRG